MSSLKFVLRPSQRGSGYPGSLCGRLIHGRKVKVMTSMIRLYPEEWDPLGQCIRAVESTHERYAYLCEASAMFEGYRDSYREVVSRLEKRGIPYSLEDILSGYRCRQSLSGLYGFSELLAGRLERCGQQRTGRAYRTAVRVFMSFYKGRDLPLKHIEGSIIKEFETSLKDRGKSMNTISYYMRMLRAIYNKAVKEQLIPPKTENPFAQVFTGLQQTRKRAMGVGCLQKLYNLGFSELRDVSQNPTSLQKPCRVQNNESTAKALRNGLYDCWRYFFFCFHARGMSFVDMAYLRKDNIRNGVISYYRKKTGQKIEITLTPYLERIIESFSSRVKDSDYLMPIIGNKPKPARLQYESGLNLQNRRLKLLGRLAGTEESLSTHVARHSWATIGKNQHLPLSVISEGLGHSSQKTTYTYLACFDHSTLDDANMQISLSVTSASAWSGLQRPG